MEIVLWNISRQEVSIIFAVYMNIKNKNAIRWGKILRMKVVSAMLSACIDYLFHRKHKSAVKAMLYDFPCSPPLT